MKLSETQQTDKRTANRLHITSISYAHWT